MAQLRPAGLFAQLGSFFFPKQVSAQIRTETLANGQVELTPVFTIDGEVIPPELVKPDESQTILGYNVVLSKPSQNLQKETQGKPTRLSKKKAGEFLTSLDRSGVVIRTRDGKVQPRIEVVKPDVDLVLETDDSLKVESELITAKGIVLDKPPSLDELKREDGWYAAGDDLIHVETSGTPLDEVLVADGGNRTLSGDEVPQLIKLIQDQSRHVGSVEKNDRLKDLSVFSGKPENRAKIDGDADSISINPTLVLNGGKGRQYEQTAADIETFERKKGGFQRVPEGWVDVSPETIDRFKHACAELSKKLGTLADIRGADIPQAISTLLGDTRTAADNNPWTVYFSEAVKNSHRVIATPAQVEFRLNIVESDGRSLLELDPIYNHERFKLTHEESEQAATSGVEWVRRRDAWIKVDQDKYKKVRAGIQLLNLQRGPTGFAFPASQREQVIDLFSILGSIQHSSSYSTFLAKLADFEKIEDVPLPATLKSEIAFRPYQKHGYNWMAFLHRFGLNGVLADDMGLGKTLQTLAVIQRAREINNSKFPSLIVCPTSVVANWRAEIQKFFRDCHVIVYTGGNRDKKLRHLQELLGLADYGLASPLVLTSYDVARLDHAKLNQIPWLYVVVDEGHNIKNPDSQRTKAIKTINAQHKLALTGTPIQNNLEELWSLFDYAMPGYLGTRTEFRELYGRGGRIDLEIIRNGKAPLKRRVHPFIMRRLKEDVAKDLPPKIVVPRPVLLTNLQNTLYKEVIESADHKRFIAEVEENGVRRSSLQLLAAYTKLRAICNHPVLADSEHRNKHVKYDDSGKLQHLKELMEEVVDGEHRALLFSQSTQMLDIIEDFFTKWRIETIRLDGQTPANRRQELVDRFNSNPAIHCFLISTKAGGTGLNLTGADTVIFYDHDWNPANDSQAQDRAYRIGQTKPVTVYKLVSKGTIEEKILERQHVKKSLADEIIGSDEEGFKDLSKDELLALFRLDEEAE